jgi:hypothetical protein
MQQNHQSICNTLGTTEAAAAAAAASKAAAAAAAMAATREAVTRQVAIALHSTSAPVAGAGGRSDCLSGPSPPGHSQVGCQPAAAAPYTGGVGVCCLMGMDPWFCRQPLDAVEEAGARLTNACNELLHDLVRVQRCRPVLRCRGVGRECLRPHPQHPPALCTRGVFHVVVAQASATCVHACGVGFHSYLKVGPGQQGACVVCDLEHSHAWWALSTWLSLLLPPASLHDAVLPTLPRGT